MYVNQSTVMGCLQSETGQQRVLGCMHSGQACNAKNIILSALVAGTDDGLLIGGCKISSGAGLVH